MAIVNAIETADFRIVNEEGCWITTEVNRGIGEPNFEYTSPNYEASSVILAREEVSFKNTSTDPYVKSEWIFGDNTTPEIVPTLVDSVYYQSYQNHLQYRFHNSPQKIPHTTHKDYIHQLHKLNGDHNSIVFQHYYDKNNLEYAKEN